MESMSSVLRTAALAEKEGFELSSEAQEEIDTALEDIKSRADDAGISTDKYLENIYGSKMSESSTGSILPIPIWRLNTVTRSRLTFVSAKMR